MTEYQSVRVQDVTVLSHRHDNDDDPPQMTMRANVEHLETGMKFVSEWHMPHQMFVGVLELMQHAAKQEGLT